MVSTLSNWIMTRELLPRRAACHGILELDRPCRRVCGVQELLAAGQAIIEGEWVACRAHRHLCRVRKKRSINYGGDYRTVLSALFPPSLTKLGPIVVPKILTLSLRCDAALDVARNPRKRRTANFKPAIFYAGKKYAIDWSSRLTRTCTPDKCQKLIATQI